MDSAIVIRESQGARAKTFEPTGSYPRLRIDAESYRESVPSLRKPAKIVMTTSIFGLLTTLYRNVRKTCAHENSLHRRFGKKSEGSKVKLSSW